MSKYKKEDLERLILIEKKSYEEIGRLFEVSGSAIKKSAIRLGIELEKRRSTNEKENFGKGIYKIEREFGKCLNCDGDFIKYKSKLNKFCSQKCQQNYQFKTYIVNWKNGVETGIIGIFSVSKYVRKYLFEKNENKCESCGWNEKNTHTGLIPLQIHHKDGDSFNTKEENLQLLCPNCHSLTDNFGSRNENGSKKRSEYFNRFKNKKE